MSGQLVSQLVSASEDLEIGDPVEDRYRGIFTTYCADDIYLAFGLPIQTRHFDVWAFTKSALAVEQLRFWWHCSCLTKTTMLQNSLCIVCPPLPFFQHRVTVL